MTKNQYKKFVLSLKKDYLVIEQMLHYADIAEGLNRDWCEGVEHAYKTVLKRLNEGLYMSDEEIDQMLRRKHAK